MPISTLIEKKKKFFPRISRVDRHFPFIFVGYRNDRFFSPYKSLYFECYATKQVSADAHISSLGYLWWNRLVSNNWTEESVKILARQ